MSMYEIFCLVAVIVFSVLSFMAGCSAGGPDDLEKKILDRAKLKAEIDKRNEEIAYSTPVYSLGNRVTELEIKFSAFEEVIKRMASKKKLK